MTTMDECTDNSSTAKKYRKVLAALKFSYFSYYFAVGCVHNFYPILLKKIHIPNSQIGVITCIGLIGGTISPLITGYLADLTKKSRLILIVITVFTIIMHAVPISTISIKLMVDAKAHGNPDYIQHPTVAFFWLLYIFQFLSTFGDQATKALLDGVCHKILTECKEIGLHCDFAHLRMYGGVGIGFSSLVTGVCLDHVKRFLPKDFPEELSLAFITILMGITVIITLVLSIPDAETSKPVSFMGAVKHIAGSPDALIAYTVQFLIQFALNVTKHFENIYIQYLGGNKTWIGISTFIGYLADVTMMYLSPTLTHAIGSMESTICIGCFVAMVRTVIFGHADSKWMSFNNSILYGFSIGLIVPTISSLIKSKAPPELISSYVSLLIATGKIGGAIASYAGGEISERYSYTMIFIISSVIFAVGGLVVIVLRIWFTPKDDEWSEKRKLDATPHENNEESGEKI